MKKYLSHNNNASPYLTRPKSIDNHQDELLNSSSSHNCQTLRVIRSIVDELYQINNQEISSKEKRVRFSLAQENESQLKLNSTATSVENFVEKEKTSIKYQPVLSDSTTVVCCLIKGRSKVDCSVSTNDIPSFRCECATQTIDSGVSSKYSNSLNSFSTITNDRHRVTSNITLSITCISSRPIIIHYPSLTSITSHATINHSLYSCENNNIVQSLNTAQRLIIPSEAKYYDICQEQVLQNYDALINDNIPIPPPEEITKLDVDALLSKGNKIVSDENIIEPVIKLCTCSKRKLSENNFSNQRKLLEELHLSKRSLQLMHNDGLFYIHDLVLICLKNMSQFYQILIKQYYLSKKQANLFVKVIEQISLI